MPLKFLSQICLQMYCLLTNNPYISFKDTNLHQNLLLVHGFNHLTNIRSLFLQELQFLSQHSHYNVDVQENKAHFSLKYKWFNIFSGISHGTKWQKVILQFKIVHKIMLQKKIMVCFCMYCCSWIFFNGTISTLSNLRYDNSKLHVSSKFQLIDQGTLHFTCSEEIVF